MDERIGNLLIKENLISKEQLVRALEEQKLSGGRLGYNITKLGFLKEDELIAFLSKQYGVPSINLADFEIDASVIKLVPEDVATKHQIIPINRAGSTLIVAMADPSNIFAVDDIKFLTGYNVEVVVASEAAIREAIDKYYDQSASLSSVMSDFDDADLELVEAGGEERLDRGRQGELVARSSLVCESGE